MPKTLYELEQGALEEFQSKFFEGEWDTDDDEASDIISEIADSRIPIFTYQVLEVAISDLWLAYDSPEIYGWSCKISPLQLIQANIYEHLQSKLFEWYYKNKND